MSLFQGIGSATVGKGGFYFLEGDYVVDVVKVFTQRDRKRRDMFIVEAAITWSSNPERKVGQVPSWCVMFEWDAALGHIKGFLAACNGADPTNDAQLAEVFRDAAGNDTTEEMSDLAVSSDNPLAGTRVALTVIELDTKSNKAKGISGGYSLHKWSPYVEPVQAQV